MKNLFTIWSMFFALVFLPEIQIQAMNRSVENTVRSSNESYVIHPDRKSGDLFPWINSGKSMVSLMMPCPGANLDYYLNPGECGILVPTFGFAYPDIPVSNLSYSLNADPDNIVGTTYCNVGQTKYSRSFNHMEPTDLDIISARIGVYQSLNNPLITLNFYTTGADLLGTYTTTIPNLNTTVHTVAIPSGTIKIPAASIFIMEVVVNAPYISIFKIGRNNAGHILGGLDATISSLCTHPNLIVEGPIGTPLTNSIVFGVTGTPDDYKFVNTNPQTSSLQEGDFFPIDEHFMSYVVTDASGASSACPFNVNVYEFEPPTNVLACNDLVQVSLGEDCETIVTPDMLLQGNQYGCFGNYTVQIIANNGVNLGNVVGYAQIGQTLQTQIFGPDGNSCWGKIHVQDKFGPELECNDIYATCSTNLKPGSPLSVRVPVSARITDGDISSASNVIKSFTIPVSNLEGTTITDLNVFLDISHDNLSDLAANITSPDGVTVPLMILQNSTCDNPNLMVTLDDEAADDHATMVGTCDATDPALTGIFAPFNPLSAFIGKPLNGDWVVTIFDLQSGNGGKVNHIDLIFSQVGGIIPFPTSNDVTFTYISGNNYLVYGIDNCSTATLGYTDEIVEEDCSSIYSKIIKRCWSGKDALNNPANECCQFIYVFRNGLSTLQFPPNYDGLNGNPGPLSCFKYGDTIPPTSVTGVPYGDLCYNVQIATPTDIRIDICKKSYKLIRTHKVIEWCSGQVIVHNQVIKVMDLDGPELTCPDDITISTDDYNCSATYKVPRPKIGDECSDILLYDLSYNPHNTFDNDYLTTNVNQLTSTISGLPLGDSWIKWTVTDECGNPSECRFKVTVVDKVLPNAVCDQFTVASITGNQLAIVDASTFDDGSVDNCGILRFEARKMVDICFTDNAVFRPTVRFCCAEVNTSVMVEFRVTDLSGNSNICMVEVRVQDKLPPYITKCPADITLDCQADYKDLKVTGEPVAIDNCEVVSVKSQDVIKVNQCGVGTVTRTWTAEDKQGFKNSCVQVITLINDDPFYYNIYDESDPKNDIKWPANYTTKKCHSNLDPSFLPAGFDRPTYNDDNCSLVAAHYKDQVFKFVDGACEKILRTWTVIDWCTYNDANPVYGQGWYEKLQIIKLQNDIAPIFEFACTDRAFATYGNCEGPVDFTMTAVDDCPENNTNLNWKYELDIDNNGSIDTTVLSARFFRVMKNGKHKIRWTVEDKCGNRAFCTHFIDVLESKKPTPYCLSSITTAVMNSNGTISIWAKDYDLGAFDNCTKKEDLWFTFYGATPVDSLINKEHYFIGDGILAVKAQYNAGIAQWWDPIKKTSGILFDCVDIPNGASQQVSVEISVTDLAGNQDYCTVVLVLQDNSNICPNNNLNLVVINGRAATTQSIGLKSAEVKLTSNSPEQNKTIKTDATGAYAFNDLPKSNNYTVGMYDNSNLLNGVSTLDLVLIQRHILGLDPFNDATKVIAGDVDNNAKVTAADLTTLRKNILGITTEFPNGQSSWRFVTANHIFVDPASPFPYTEKYVFNQLTDNKVNQNFIGIKIGDVNKSATFNVNGSSTESRSSKTLALELNEIQASQGQDVQIPVLAKEFDAILGYQFTLEFDASLIDITDVVANELLVTDANFGMHKLSEGIITTSWNNDDPISIQSGKTMFTIKGKAKQDLKGRELIKLTSVITPAMAFDKDQQMMNVSLTNRSQAASTFELMQNKPNPFHDKTNITFRLPDAGKAMLKIFDMTGKVIKVVIGEYAKGDNVIEIDKSELGTSGVLMYQIESGKFTATKKMIIIE
ncbi:MAG: T9SS type A sorting domain-containing protein [Saprospiraceae bacterium]|nr:T9SS type A sorting domain-containing protein [Saprospiraceae bacterium]